MTTHSFTDLSSTELTTVDGGDVAGTAVCQAGFAALGSGLGSVLGGGWGAATGNAAGAFFGNLICTDAGYNAMGATDLLGALAMGA